MKVRGVSTEPRTHRPGPSAHTAVGTPVGTVPHRVLQPHPGGSQDTGQSSGQQPTTKFDLKTLKDNKNNAEFHHEIAFQYFIFFVFKIAIAVRGKYLQ